MYATLIALLAVVPVVVMEGRPGAFFEPLALAYALAVAGRDGGGLTVDAGVDRAALRARAARPARAPLLRRLPAALRRGARALRARRARWLPAAAGALLVAVLAVLPLLGTSPIPSLEDRDVLVRLDAEPGTSNRG